MINGTGQVESECEPQHFIHSGGCFTFFSIISIAFSIKMRKYISCIQQRLDASSDGIFIKYVWMLNEPDDICKDTIKVRYR
jgi:hypothetical protein